MSYNLFLDDLRSVNMVFSGKKDSDFVIVRSFSEFVTIIKSNGLPQFISFDNDLGLDENGNIAPDGYECVKWMVNKSGFDLQNLKYFVHSANPVAKSQINSLLENFINFQKSNAK